MFTNIKYILITALRDWLFLGLILAIIAAAYVSGVMGSTAMVEMEQMTLSYSAASSRLIVMIGLIVFICFHVRNAFDTKEIDVILSRPISRPNLVLSYFLGFSLVALLVVIPTIGIVSFMGLHKVEEVGWQWTHNTNGLIAWSVSLFLESLFVVGLALFASLMLKSAVASVMVSMGLYTLSRMMGFFVVTSKSGLLFRDHEINLAAKYIMGFVSIFVPRLDFFAKSDWIVYGIKESATELVVFGVEHIHEAYLFLIQSAVFIPLLLAAAILDFRRKQF